MASPAVYKDHKLPGTGAQQPFATPAGGKERALYAEFSDKVQIPAKAPEAKSTCCCNYLHLAIGLTVLAVAAAAVALLIIFCPPVGSAVAAVMAPSLAAGLLGGLSAVSGIGAGVCYYLHFKNKAESL